MFCQDQRRDDTEQRASERHARCRVCVLSLEFVREPEWTLHCCAVACWDVICFVSLFTARPLRAVAEWLTGLAADWTVASPPF